jgi:tetratricopeptide (TPR) repeat protein
MHGKVVNGCWKEVSRGMRRARRDARPDRTRAGFMMGLSMEVAPMFSLSQPAVTLLILTSLAAAGSAQSPTLSDADRLYANRGDLASARQAAELWRAALQRNPRDFEAASKLAQADYWLGWHLPERDRSAAFDDGVEQGRLAISLEPKRPDGYFWLAANLGGQAELSSRAGLRNRTPIKENLATVLRIDPAFLQGSADRALGRFYTRVPRLLGGNRKEAETHLRASLMYNPDSTASRFFLAELLDDMGRRPEARAEAQKVIDLPLDPFWAPEDKEFKMKARALLDRLK